VWRLNGSPRSVPHRIPALLLRHILSSGSRGVWRCWHPGVLQAGSPLHLGRLRLQLVLVWGLQVMVLLLVWQVVLRVLRVLVVLLLLMWQQLALQLIILLVTGKEAVAGSLHLRLLLLLVLLAVAVLRRRPVGGRRCLLGAE
jgi:hypothetical protein